jgi:type I restriction enzyme R subunit
MNETETRAEHIDPALAAAGWNVVEGSRIWREYPITLGRIEGRRRRGTALKADYVLKYRNTKLATVEAKAWDQPLTEGVGQAKDYAAKLALRYTYATNGQGIYAIDMQTGHEGEKGKGDILLFHFLGLPLGRSEDSMPSVDAVLACQ